MPSSYNFRCTCYPQNSCTFTRLVGLYIATTGRILADLAEIPWPKLTRDSWMGIDARAELAILIYARL